MTDKAVSELTAASALNDADLILISQSGVSKKLLASALKTYTGGGTVTSVSGTGTVNGLSLSGTVTSTGNLTLSGTLDLSAPPAIGATTASTGKFTNLEYTGTLTGGTGVIAIGTSQIYKDASGNVGIGTSSPAWKLTVSDGTTTGGMVPNGGNLYLGTISNSPILFRTNNTDKMTLDSSGNLGLGVTPSAWSARAIDFSTGSGVVSTVGGDGSSTFASINAYNNGANWVYKSAGTASLFQLYGNTYRWFNAGSGSAGGTISFTQAMTLDASGNLLVGTTSAIGKLTLGFSTGSATITQASLFSSHDIFFQGNGNTGGYTVFEDYGGSGVYVSTGSTTPIIFTPNRTERARIDSSGNLLVGLTTPVSSSRLRINSANTTDSTICGTFQNGNNSELFSVYDAGAIRAQYIGTTTGTALILDASGYIKKSSSSRRYKTNEQPIDIGLDFILNLEPVSYDLIDGNIPQVGFIAEDFPDDRFVSRSMVDPSDESKGYQVEGVDYAHIVAPLVKAIQEIAKRLEALENK